MRQLFAPFGQISTIEIVKDAAGQSQGYGYVEFTSMPDASKAMQQWDGQEVVGQKLSVKIAPLAPGQAQTFALPQLDLDDDEGEWYLLGPVHDVDRQAPGHHIILLCHFCTYSH